MHGVRKKKKNQKPNKPQKTKQNSNNKTTNQHCNNSWDSQATISFEKPVLDASSACFVCFKAKSLKSLRPRKGNGL
jgi:hypothetical protein